jgi:hypothetical protein
LHLISGIFQELTLCDLPANIGNIKQNLCSKTHAVWCLSQQARWQQAAQRHQEIASYGSAAALGLCWLVGANITSLNTVLSHRTTNTVFNVSVASGPQLKIFPLKRRRPMLTLRVNTAARI